MIQQPRTVFAAPLIDIDFAKSGNDWIDAISKRIDIDKLYDIVMTEYKRQYNLTV